MSKLQELCDVEGMSLEDLLRDGVMDGVCYGICCNKGCNYTTEVEPDCSDGWCENCESNSVKSGLILAGAI